MTTRVHPDKAARRPHVPEEGRAFDRAIALLRGTKPLDFIIRGNSGLCHVAKNARGATYKVVFILDDGRTFGAREKWRSAVEDKHKGDWIGRIEFGKSQRHSEVSTHDQITSNAGVTATLHVYSQQGFEYQAGELDMSGNVLSKGQAPPPLESQDGEPSGGRSLEHMRNWLAAGCPPDEE